MSSGESISTVMSFGSSWTAVSNDSWISFAEPDVEGFQTMSLEAAVSGDNEDKIKIIAEPNSSNQMRSGTVTVTAGGETSTITVNQDGTGEWMNLSKTSISATANGKEDSIAVTSNINWYPLLDVDCDWITLAYDHDTENGVLPIVIDSNTTSEERTADITITGIGVTKTITVTQEAYSASSDATLGDLTISTGDLTPAFNPAVTNYTVSVPNSVSSVTLAATANQSNATVSGTGVKNLSVGSNNFTITVTAPNETTEIDYTIVVTREAAAPTGTYDLYFDEELYYLDLEYYPEEDWYNPSITLSATAVGTDAQGNSLTATIVYTNGYTTNATSEFTAMDLWWDSNYITATATFSDGKVLEIDTEIWISIIAPRK